MAERRAHVPVLLAEVIDVLDPKDGGLYVDGTFGAGGYTRAILQAADCAVIGIDRDPRAIEDGQGLMKEFAGRLTLIQGRFGDMQAILEKRGIREVDGIALDVGVSSMQIDRAERGFSFAKDGPLDMRMSGEGRSAADAVNLLDQDDLRRIIAVYGEEKRARRIATAIVEARASKPIETTGELAALIEKTIGKAPDSRIHPSTRTFQGLRIFVNDELGELAAALAASEKILRPSGRLAVVSFHSLEDRMVKSFLRARSGHRPSPSRHIPVVSEVSAATFELLTRRAIKPSDDEIAGNPRARSARLRGAVRTTAEVGNVGVGEHPNVEVSWP
jgi:16S rRNA (cytosine1402-N4)-methyltransferase